MLGNPFVVGCVLRRVSGRVGGREKSMKQVEKSEMETKIERWWKSIEYEFTADVFLEEASKRAARDNDLTCGRSARRGSRRLAGRCSRS